MSVRESLIAARALIDTPEKWIKGSSRNGQGGYCALGAMDKIGPESGCYLALRSALPSEEPGFVAAYNDLPTTTHADILALFDRAIAACEAP